MIPDNLQYSETHEWTRIEDNEAVVGITQFAQEQLGDLTFVELPEVGQQFTAGEEMGSVESVKAASEIYTPVTGEVIAVNEDLENEPGMVNDEPYEGGWLVRFSLTTDPEGLMDAEAYGKMLEEESH